MLSLETKLSPACPRELSVRNMVRRVLGIVREEAENAGLGPLFHAAMEASKTREEGPSRPAPSRPLLTSRTSFAASTQASVTSLFNTLSAHSPLLSAATTPDHSGMHTPVQQLPPGSPGAQRDIRPAVLQDIKELVDELESSEAAIAEYAPQLLHRNELILTYGLPPLVHRLLLKAAHRRDHDFTVVVVEGSPNVRERTHAVVMNKLPPASEDGPETTTATAAATAAAAVATAATTTTAATAAAAAAAAARKSLQDRGIQVIVIADSDIYNFIGRVNKVFLAANYVLADGAVLATAGALNVARAAKKLCKPVVVVAGSHAMCPVTSYDQEVLVEMGPPVTVGYDEAYLLDNADFQNPLVDYIEPQFVTMFVTNK